MKALLNTSIKLVAAQAALTVLHYGGSLNVVDILNAEVEFYTNELSLSFENPKARSNFYTAVKARIKANSPEAYEKAFPPVGMDQNGNYTTDKRKWA